MKALNGILINKLIKKEMKDPLKNLKKKNRKIKNNLQLQPSFIEEGLISTLKSLALNR